MIIDVHTHIIPKHLPDFTKQFGYGQFIQLDHHQEGKAWMMQGDKRFREILANCWDAEIRIEEMAQHGVDKQVICTIPVSYTHLNGITLVKIGTVIDRIHGRERG